MKTSNHIAISLIFATCYQMAFGAGIDPTGAIGSLPGRNALPKTPELPRSIERSLEDKLNRSFISKELDETIDPINPLPTEIGEILTVTNLAGETVLTEVVVEGQHRAVQFEWMTTVTHDQANIPLPAAINIIEQVSYPAIGVATIRFRVPAPFDNFKSLSAVLPNSWIEGLDRNHIYDAQTERSSSHRTADSAKEKITSLNSPAVSSVAFDNHCDVSSVRIGMIDTGVDTTHKAFSESHLITHSFLPDKSEEPTGHGTAVASLLVGRTSENKSQPVLNELFAASTFYARNEYSQGATLNHLLKGLNWLVEQDVTLINMSLTGPDNRLLKQFLKKIHSKGTFIVAAVGNHGPAAPAAFPAGYDFVIAVTAVNDESVVYRWANQGPHVDFAAQGVNVTAARLNNTFGPETGTSIATPLVTRKIACLATQQTLSQQTLSQQALSGEKNAMTNLILEQLKLQALDLGKPGYDPVFGFGLVR